MIRFGKKQIAMIMACAAVLSSGLSGTASTAKAGPQPYLGDVMIVGFNFCPRDWEPANGQLLPIAQYTALFSLLGTQFGGDGRTTFALPDLRGRVIAGQGRGPGLSPRVVNQKYGTETQTMTTSTMPPHSHAVNANNLDGDRPGPRGKLLAAAPTGGTGNETIYSTEDPTVTMNPAMIGNSGGSIPFSTMDPALGLYHCIAINGDYPSRN